MPWLTPDSIPEDDDCRPLLIPADSVWLALVSGALTELTLPYNWQKFGTLTVAETVAKMQTIIDNYYNSPCAVCTVPGGYPVVRINIEGHLEELGADGAWHSATGDYLIPPPSARTDGTPPDQNCLAAKNATNALHTLYTNLSESFASELSADEALTALIAAAIATIGFEFAPITFAIAAVILAIFETLYSALAYVTADLWTDAFSEQFACILLGCVINTAGVVTFDWDCFNNALNAQSNNFGLSEVQKRLYVQIGYLLYFIGGVDGLNLAARTTAITDDNCDFCGWCRFSDLRGATDGWTIGEAGSFESYGARGTVFDANNAEDVQIIRTFTATTINSVSIKYGRFGGSGANQGVFVQLYLAGTQVYSYTASGTTTNPGTWPAADLISGPSGLTITADEIRVQLNDGSSGASCYIESVTTTGQGTNTLGGDNC